tara:strand:- start:169681 stop:170364 length:684 start_codon:yes stop_codon:yes gene_type:complete
MKNTMKLFTLVCMALAIATFSCTPEDGQDGMDGIQGEQGVPGMDGTDGQDGANGQNGSDGSDGQDGQDGEDGNANVFSGTWVEYDDTVWTAVSNEFGVEYRNYPIVVPEITQDVVDNGVVLVYTRFVITATQVYALPFTDNITGADPEGQTLTYRFEVNDLTIKMRNVSGSGDPGTFGGPGIAEYRYVIIPAQGRSAGLTYNSLEAYLASKGVDITNYDQVASYYKL